MPFPNRALSRLPAQSGEVWHRSDRRSVHRPSVLVRLLVYGVLALLWGLMGAQAVDRRAAALEDAQQDLGLLANSYADYAVALGVVVGGRNYAFRFLSPEVDRAALNAFRQRLHPVPGVHVRLWSVPNGAWLAGDPPNSNPRDPRLGDRLVARAERLPVGVVAAADWTRTEALERWRNETITGAVRLGALTLIVLMLHHFLQLQLRSREEIEARWDAVLTHTTDGIFLVQVERATDQPAEAALRFVLKTVNPATVAIWKFPGGPESAIGREICELLPEWARPALAEHLRKCAGAGESGRFELAAPDGSFATEVTIVPLYREHDPSAAQLVVTCRDVTEHKRHQKNSKVPWRAPKSRTARSPNS